MRYSGKMPKYEVLIDPAVTPVNVDFRTSGLLKPTLGTPDGVHGIRLAQPLLRRAHANQLCRISGATNGANNGLFRITDVPSAIGEVGAWGAGGAPGSLQAGMVAVVENTGMVHSLANAAVKLEMFGAQWRAQLYITVGGSDILVAELIEPRVQADPDGWQRASIAAHVSKLAITTGIKFILSLERADLP
jgi:hypothetical protein